MVLLMCGYAFRPWPLFAIFFLARYLRFLDTGVKPFITEGERIATAAQRVTRLLH
jgi:hypothetical protein